MPNECDKAFKCKMGLLQHRVVHSGEKPFMCQTCGLSFGLKYNFQRHMRLHSGEKPFRYIHTHNHTRFLLSSQLKQHQLLHTGKPYECVVCSRKFRQSNQLKSHMQIHTGVKLYSCDRCSQGFSDSRQLKKHCCGEDGQSALESSSKRRKHRNDFSWTEEFTHQ
uniref:C2H2-type domain-containing protein n=1 Tax=Mastacembelus armatus TaxID=205130 RepID=A0A7N8XIP9_9TELE